MWSESLSKQLREPPELFALFARGEPGHERLDARFPAGPEVVADGPGRAEGPACLFTPRLEGGPCA